MGPRAWMPHNSHCRRIRLEERARPAQGHCRNQETKHCSVSFSLLAPLTPSLYLTVKQTRVGQFRVFELVGKTSAYHLTL